MNNKGQSLVLFILIIPLILLIFIMIKDVSSILLTSNELNNLSYHTTNYALDLYKDELFENNLINDNKIKKLILKNNPNINKISIDIKENKIYLTISSNSKTLLINKINFKIDSKYVGYYQNNKKIIERIK